MAEGVRCDADGVYAGVLGHGVLEGRRGAGRALRLVEHVGDRLGGEGAPPKGIGDRRVEGGGAETIEEAEQSGGGATQVAAAEGDGAQERIRVVACGSESVAASKLVGMSLGLGEWSQVRGVLNELEAVVGPGVMGDDTIPIRDPDRRLRRDEGDWLADQGMWDRIVIQVEADVWRLAGYGGSHEVARKRVLGQG